MAVSDVDLSPEAGTLLGVILMTSQRMATVAAREKNLEKHELSLNAGKVKGKGKGKNSMPSHKATQTPPASPLAPKPLAKKLPAKLLQDEGHDPVVTPTGSRTSSPKPRVLVPVAEARAGHCAADHPEVMGVI